MTKEVRDDLRNLNEAVPNWLVGTVIAILGLSSVFALFLQRVGTVVTVWLWLVRLSVLLFVIYLFYRLVLAAERIAEKI